MTSEHPKAADMTLSEFFENIYRPTFLTERSYEHVRQFRVALGRWALLTTDPPIKQITTEILVRFAQSLERMKGKRRGHLLSPATVTDKLNYVQSLLFHAGPKTNRHPDALGIIPAPVPWYRPPRITQDPGSVLDQAIDESAELMQYLKRYLAERAGRSAGYCQLLAATVRQLCAWAGRPLTLAEIDRSLLGRWATCLAAAYRPASVNGKLRMVRSLLLAAWDDGLLTAPPRRNHHLPENLPSPEAWTSEECRRLFDYLTKIPGRVGQQPASDWWTSLCLTIYWTGCRISAMLAAEVQDYTAGVGLLIRRQKNGRSQWYPLPESCCTWIDRVLPPEGPIWHWPHHNRTLWLHFRNHVQKAGLPCPMTHGSLFHRIRRTNASYCAAEDPALAQRQLDHSSLQVTRASYIDPTIARGRSAIDVLPDPLQPAPSGDNPPPWLRIIRSEDVA